MAHIHSPRIVTDGLVLALDAGNTKSYPGSGTTWSDLSGNGNSGTLTNGPTFNSDNGGSIVFDGSNDYVNCGQGLVQAGSWTISAVCRFTVSNRLQAIFCRTGAAPSYPQNYVLAVLSNNKFVVGSSADSYAGVQSTTSISLNTWYYATGTYNSNTKKYSMYVNDNLEGVSPTALVGSPSTAGTQYVTIGAGDGLSAANPMGGRVAIVQLYNRELSTQEIQQNFIANRKRFGL